MTRTYKTRYIRLNSNEWGNERMRQKARRAFAADPDLDHVTVIEHAGWFLEFNRDLVIVGTANDMAILSEEARQWWASVNASGGVRHVALCEVA